jgi:hypothetical protein
LQRGYATDDLLPAIRVQQTFTCHKNTLPKPKAARCPLATSQSAIDR